MEIVRRRVFKKALPFIGAFAVVAGIFNSWFLRFGIRTAGDWGFYLKGTADTLRRHYFSIWLSDEQFGRVLIDSGQALTYAAYGWLSYYFNTSFALNERIIHLWPAVIVSIVGPYFLAKHLFRDRTAAILSAIVYSANTYHLALLTGHLTLAGAYAFAPLVILFYLKAITTRRVTHVIWCALLFVVCGAYEPRSAYIVAMILMLLAAVHFWFVWLPRNTLNIKSLIPLLLSYGTPFVLFVLMNMYWILGLAYAGGAAANSTIIASALFGNQFFNISEALTLFHPYWTGGEIQPFFAHPIPLYFWLIPIAAIVSLILNKKNPILLFFALLGIIGILLTKQSDEPFPGLYLWLFRHVPDFNAFREASKFYMLTALSYAVLLPALYWYIKNRYKRRALTIASFAILTLLFAPNLIPIATNQIGATFEPRSIPPGYTQLNAFLNEPTYNRILWVPQPSRWSLATATHPPVNISEVIGDAWSNLSDTFMKNDNGTSTDEITNLLHQNYAPSLLSAAGIKYAVVPMRDIQNNDNFYFNYNDDPSIFTQALASAYYLKEASTQVDGFKVYQTLTPPKPYFSSTTSLYSVNGGDALPSSYNLWQTALGGKGDFNFTLDDKHLPYTTDITDIFQGYNANQLKEGSLPITAPTENKTAATYFDSNFSNFSYTATAKSITIRSQKLPDPNGHTPPADAPITIPLQTSKDYVIASGDNIYPVDRSTTPVLIGSPRTDATVYAIDTANLVPQPTIQGSLWQKAVDNCAPYGPNAPDIAMDSVTDDLLKAPVVSLTAVDHAACTGPPAVPVVPGTKYLWRFQYRSSSSQFATYKLTFNTPDHQTIEKDIPSLDSNWHTYQTIIDIPAGATQVQIQLLSRPSNQVSTVASISYTGEYLAPIHSLTSITQLVNPTPAPTPTSATYKGYTYNNLIPNGSFTDGLWKKQVGDCDAYDNNAALQMSRTDQAPSGSQYALQLEAKRHIACTDTGSIPVQGGATYVLQFDYQSPNAQDASYIINFDDKNATTANQSISILDPKWHTYTRTITAPPDAHSLTLTVFAYSDDGQANYIINRYANFVLQQVPDVANRFYTVSTPTVTLGNPQNITYHSISNTSKKVTITGADRPFLLLMSEQYHGGWQAVLSDKDASVLSPWSKLPTLPASDHLEVNDFENAWYINPQQICSTYPSICSQNPDGSYDIHLSILFAPQRWFNFGLLISGFTALACVAILIYVYIKPLQRQTIIMHRRILRGHASSYVKR